MMKFLSLHEPALNQV